MVPPTIVDPVDPARPAMKREIMTADMLVAVACGMIMTREVKGGGGGIRFAD